MYRLILFLAVLTLTACAPPKVDLAVGSRTYQPADYEDVFYKWSRDKQSIPVDGGDNVLTVRATWMSYDFRWAYVVRMAHDFRLSPGERQELRDEQFSALDTHIEFFVTAMSGIKGADKLLPDEGPWRIRLEDDAGRQLVPDEIIEFDKPDLTLVDLFYFNPNYRKAYRLRFPLTFEDGQPVISATTRFIQLTFSSTLGQSTLRWELLES